MTKIVRHPVQLVMRLPGVRKIYTYCFLCNNRFEHNGHEVCDPCNDEIKAMEESTKI